VHAAGTYLRTPYDIRTLLIRPHNKISMMILDDPGETLSRERITDSYVRKSSTLRK
jgi:hypothetical protein